MRVQNLAEGSLRTLPRTLLIPRIWSNFSDGRLRGYLDIFINKISTYDWASKYLFKKYMPYYNKDLLPTSLKFLCCGESLFYLFDSKHENVVINYHYNCSSWNEKWWFVFHFSANVFSPEVILDKYLFWANLYWNEAGSAHYQVNIYHCNF